MLRKDDPKGEDTATLAEYLHLVASAKEQARLVKDLFAGLDNGVKEKYPLLTEAEIIELLVNRKWFYSIFDGIKGLYTNTSHQMANRIAELAERYAETLPELEKKVEEYESKVKSHLERMGFVW